MARYQQGIGVKEASSVPSTFNAPNTWQEPKAPAINRVNFTPANSGASRNYGSTPQYVDTVGSRWEHGEKGALINAATGFSKQARMAGGEPITEPSPTRTMTRPGVSEEALARRERAGGVVRTTWTDGE